MTTKPPEVADGLRGLTRLARATRVSYVGLAWALRNEEAFRVEAALFVVLCPAAFWWADTGVARAVCILSLLLVIVTELLNTGLEAAIDRIGPERHALSGVAKDLGSAAVHVSLLQVPLIWCLVRFG